MRKTLFIVAAMLSLTFSQVRAEVDDNAMLSETTLVVSGNSVQVGGGNGLKLEVFKITGEQVTVIDIDSDAKSFKLNLPKGCYILRVGKLTRKVSIC